MASPSGCPSDLFTQSEPGSNYRSVEEVPEKAGAELDRAVVRGYATQYCDWQHVIEQHGKAPVSKLACIIKTRPDGSEKVRLVIDMRQSGYNSLVRAAERLVLPRLKDLVEDVLSLAPQINVDLGDAGKIPDR